MYYSNYQCKDKTIGESIWCIFLMMAALPKAKNEMDISTLFDDDLHSKLKKCKPDILKTYDHFGSKGECYAFGNKPN